jgi:hypothetical protein
MLKNSGMVAAAASHDASITASHRPQFQFIGSSALQICADLLTGMLTNADNKYIYFCQRSSASLSAQLSKRILRIAGYRVTAAMTLR